jgi:hypothetical protein
MRGTLVCSAMIIALAAAPALAIQTRIGAQFIEDFEGYPTGPVYLPYRYTPAAATFELTGGIIALGTVALPARSGTQVYSSSGSISLARVPGSADYYYGASVYVSGTAPITFNASGFILTSGANANNYRFSYSEADMSVPGTLPYIDTLTITSDAPFVIDDLVIGSPTAHLPVPEPASWVMLIAGFGLIGGIARRQRSATA